MVAVLNFIPDPAPAIRRYIEAMAPGSRLVITHSTDDAEQPKFESVTRLYDGTATPGVIRRGRAEVEALMDGLDLVDPGVVWTQLWRPDVEPGAIDPRHSLAYAAVGRRR
jgi:hypothetical protein